MIVYPDLEIRNEDQLAADAIGRISGGLTADIVNEQIAARRALLPLIQAGLSEPICPELTNANPSAPHTVIIEAIAWALAQQAHRINQIPQANLIAFANLFDIDQGQPTKATTMLTFTVDPPLNTDVTVAAGTQVATSDGTYKFETLADLVIPYGTSSAQTAARNLLAGRTLLSPNVLVSLVDNPAYVTAVTNSSAIDSGTDLEPLEKTLERVKQYQRRGERLVSVKDLEDAIFQEAMHGNGVVRAFPFVKNGDYLGDKLPGYTTVVVMTNTGDPVDDATRTAIALLSDTAVGNQFIYLKDPSFVSFNVEASVRVSTGSPTQAVQTAIEAALRAFYAAARAQFGRPILRSEIIAVIEGTAGVDRIVAGDTSIIAQPAADRTLAEFELPKLVDVTITVVT
jgi:uncharacterized phage protein gp47/JayE